MWKQLCIISVIIYVTVGKLIGDHICQEEERFTVNVTEYVTRNTTVRNYKWCLNYPPRCSFYTVRAVAVPQIIEKTVTNITEKCCPGYKEDGDRCISVCPSCVNGKCQNGNCECNAGYQGNNCETECETSRWGVNCAFQCDCERGSCHSETGNCVCPAGWNGTRCHLECPRGYYGMGCNYQCNCYSYEICDKIDGNCYSPSTTIATTTSAEPTTINQQTSSESDLNTYSTTPFPTDSTSFPSTSKEIYIIKAPVSNTDPKTKLIKPKVDDKISSAINEDHKLEPKKIKDSNFVYSKDGQFVFKQNKPLLQIENLTSTTELFQTTTAQVTTTSAATLTTTEHIEVTRMLPILKDNELNQDSATTDSNLLTIGNDDDKESRNDIYEQKQFTTTSNEIKSKTKVIKTKDTSTVNDNLFHDENYLSDEAREDTINHYSTGNTDLMNSVGGATAITVAVILIVVVLLVIQWTRRIKKKGNGRIKNGQKSVGVSAVSPYNHSIFHTPLPDPPTYENPAYLTPVEFSSEGKTFKPQYICTINSEPQNEEARDYLYDHPPSTGSYRAASIPEPLEADMSLTLTPSLTQMEPVYDEIPSRDTPTPISQPSLPYESSSLYMNTCGKTRF